MGTSFKGKVITVIVLWILGIFGASTAIVSKARLWARVFWVLSLATSIISFINIFFSLRRNQIHAQNSVSQEQASRIIPLYHVCSAFWVQLTVACYLPLIIVRQWHLKEGEYLHCFTLLGIYCYFSLFELIIKPAALLLEDPRGEASSKNNNIRQLLC